jgi:hypothetical protein
LYLFLGGRWRPPKVLGSRTALAYLQKSQLAVIKESI